MAIHSINLAWEIPWTEEPGGYSLWSLKESNSREHARTRQVNKPHSSCSCESTDHNIRAPRPPGDSGLWANSLLQDSSANSGLHIYFSCWVEIIGALQTPPLGKSSSLLGLCLVHLSLCTQPATQRVPKKCENEQVKMYKSKKLMNDSQFYKPIIKKNFFLLIVALQMCYFLLYSKVNNLYIHR